MTPNLPPWWFWLFVLVQVAGFVSLELNRIPKPGVPILSGGEKIGEVRL
ncbi:MAG: hypothetical protein ACOY4M_08310 [Pseudomonadota bacterium]